MSYDQYAQRVEQDRGAPPSGNDLPTYDDLATQNGPNSRFGRWKSWIEKRAAERYADLTPDELARRRQRGWGNDEYQSREKELPPPPSSNSPLPYFSNLQIRTDNLTASSSQPYKPRTPSPPLRPLPFVSQRVEPSQLKLNQFGSRFLPHATAPIRCLLPLESDRLLLVGHDEGLSVLDMFPHEWTESGTVNVKGPDEAQARLIWQGESVYQMSLLEIDHTVDGAPQGVVLMLVGPEPDSAGGKDTDSIRALRMYNLASLISLAKWAIGQKGVRPLDLHRPPNWQVQQSPSKRHRPQSSIARSLKSLIDAPNPGHHLQETSTPSSYSSLLVPTVSRELPVSSRTPTPSGRITPNRRDPDESSWDVVDDLTLRWATDYVPLATPGSRLENSSVIAYALWSDETKKGRGGRLLAVATKNNILLYETPKGERAFRFVKEFYTPLQPRSITFFHQSVQEANRSPTEVNPHRFHPSSHRRSDSNSTTRGVPDSSRANAATGMLNYGVHLSLFVVFDKKAGWIRVTDSAVGEIDINDSLQWSSDTLSSSSNLRSRVSFESYHSLSPRQSSPKWIPPVRCDVHMPGRADLTSSVYLLTRGKCTQIVPCPLPVGLSYQPYCTISWHCAPTGLSARVCEFSTEDEYQPWPFIQVVAFTEEAVEVQEVSAAFLNASGGGPAGKGKSRSLEPVRAEVDVGGDTGFLCVGGHWDDPHHLLNQQVLSRSQSASSTTSANSYTSLDTDVLLERMERERGMYGWCRRGLQDWRVFWVGGSPSNHDHEESA